VLLQVLDEHGRGVPVGFMISSSDTVEVVEKFLRALQQGVSVRQLRAEQLGSGQKGHKACWLLLCCHLLPPDAPVTASCSACCLPLCMLLHLLMLEPRVSPCCCFN
jgi:hypothetical protein